MTVTGFPEPNPRPPICVLGLGLIGGSVLRAAIKSGRVGWGYNRSPEAVTCAQSEGFDAGTDLEEALRRAQQENALIVIAVPMPAVETMVQAISTYAPDCPITDVISVKVAVREVIYQYGLLKNYVGGHPMAGTSESGWSASSAELFTDAVWVIAADTDMNPAVWTQVAQLALDCGSVISPAQSEEHDAAVARISHLPHLLAETLALVGANGGDLALRLAAGSFRDGTRVASTAPELVRAMCEANSTALVAALNEAIDTLTSVRESLGSVQSAQNLVEQGHSARQRYETLTKTVEGIVGVDFNDPDWVWQLRTAGQTGAVIRSALPGPNNP
ncbi:MAG: prephenate dehydrogenase [Mycobacteriaceae bacterium]